MKKYNINSVSQYLKILEENNISDYIYRGQNEPYFSIQASGFRPYKGGWDSDKIYDLEHLHLAFLNRMISSITEDEKKHFLAFCQHHGIPTNLVDVSYSPLVALFFACEGKGEMKFSLQDLINTKSIDELDADTSLQKMLIHNLINQARKPFYSSYAQTYMIKKQRLINITDIIIKLNGKSMFEEILTSEALALDLLNSIKIHFASLDTVTLNRWLKNISCSYISACEVDFGTVLSEKLYQKIKKIIKKKREFTDSECSQIYKILISDSDDNSSQNCLYKELMDDLSFNSQTTKAVLYTIMLVEILHTIKSYPRKIIIDLDVYFTYQPPELFGRISSQQSLFIYQPYLYTNDGTYDYCELNVQSINPDILIEIDSYEDILNELNLLGINNGTLYGDIDNIAKSILKSAGTLLKV